MPESVVTKSRKTPVGWYTREVIAESFWIALIATFFPVCIFGYLATNDHWEDSLAWTVG